MSTQNQTVGRTAQGAEPSDRLPLAPGKPHRTDLSEQAGVCNVSRSY